MDSKEISPIIFLLLTLFGVAVAVSIMRSFAPANFLTLAIIGTVFLLFAFIVTWRFFDQEPEDLMEDDFENY
ncbi:MAG: hypothetical protein AB8G22_05140 [Saprospiraceae bacterium]